MKSNYKAAIHEIIEEIDNEEYLELIKRFAERLSDGGTE